MGIATPAMRLMAGVALAAMVSTVVLAPLASAHGSAHPSVPAFGTSVWGIKEMKAQGVQPAYALIWATKVDADKGFENTKKQLAMARDAGVTPVVQWYYWGDSISVSCVKYGCSGKSRAQWDSYAYKLASIVSSTMGGKLAIVVLETEFNKNGVQYWEDFDGYLQKQSNIFKAKGIQTALGFGNWGKDHWGRFDRAIGSVHYLSIQTLRSAYRQTDTQMKAAAEDLIAAGKYLHDRFGKRVLVTDYAISTWSGKEWIQKNEVSQVVWQKSKLTGSGIVGVIYRWVKDVPTMSWGHHGYAEKYWGLKYSDGRWKPGFNEWYKGTKNGASAWSAYNG